MKLRVLNVAATRVEERELSADVVPLVPVLLGRRVGESIIGGQGNGREEVLVPLADLLDLASVTETEPEPLNDAPELEPLPGPLPERDALTGRFT